LRTLIGRNFIWQRVADGAYLPSRRAGRIPPNREARLVEIASPLMIDLCETVRWPSVLAVRRGPEMVVIETNRPRSTTPHFALGPVGFRVPMLSSSTGRAYFAFCGADEREEILALLRAAEHPPPASGDRAWLARLVAMTQAQGYGAREPAYRPDQPEAAWPADDGRNSIAVPVIVAGRVVATMNLTWSRRTSAAGPIVAAHFPPLRDAAAEMARRLASDSSLG